MNDPILEIDVLSWKKFNPRSDVRQCVWFRFDAASVHHHVLAGLDDKSFRLWVTILCHSTNGRGKCQQLVSKLCRDMRVKWPKLRQCLDLLQVSGMIRYELKLPYGNNEVIEPTDERTNERTNATEETSQSSSKAEPESEPTKPVEVDHRPRLIFDLWNELNPNKKVFRLTESMRAKIKTRLSEFPDLDLWQTCFEKVRDSSYLQGEKWMSFNWLVKNEDNFVKTTSGNYDDKKPKAQPNKNRDMTHEDIMRELGVEA